jgi:hypothetical protein
MLEHLPQHPRWSEHGHGVWGEQIARALSHRFPILDGTVIMLSDAHLEG